MTLSIFDFVDMESAGRQLHVPSEDTNDGHHCDNEDAVAAEDVMQEVQAHCQ